MVLYRFLGYDLVPLRIVHNIHPDGWIQRLNEAQWNGVGILILVDADGYGRTTPSTFPNILFKQLGIDICCSVMALPVWPQIFDAPHRFRNHRRLVGVLVPLVIVQNAQRNGRLNIVQEVQRDCLPLLIAIGNGAEGKIVVVISPNHSLKLSCSRELPAGRNRSV